jgi:hypothetical protein
MGEGEFPLEEVLGEGKVVRQEDLQEITFGSLHLPDSSLRPTPGTLESCL